MLNVRSMYICSKHSRKLYCCRCSQLTSELSTAREEVVSLSQTVTDKNQELEVNIINGMRMCVYNLCCGLQTLRECLRQVTSATDDMKEEEQVEEVEGANLERKKEESLAKIQAMLDTTKVISF